MHAASHSPALVHVWKQTLRVAIVFWATCLVLVALEATLGSNPILAGIFFLSIPILVGFLIWANHAIALRVERRMLSVVMLGASVLLSSSVIILVGLFAAANLKVLMTGA